MSDREPTRPTVDDSVPILIDRVAGGRRLTIAVLMDYMTQFVGSYEAQFRDAFHLKCRERDINLLLVYGGMVDQPYFGSKDSVGLFDLVRSANVDGFVIMSSLIASMCGSERLRQFVQPFRELPSCSVGMAIPGIPSIVIENRRGMDLVVEHLLTTHGVRRPLFLGGPQENSEAIERLAAYRDGLARHGITADPALEKVGDFMARGAYLAMEEVLAAKVPFDSVIAANDIMALTAVNVLLRHGYRVPRDILVTGFDNLAAAGLGNPPLTTLAQPFEIVAEQAIQSILDQRVGVEAQACTSLPIQLVVRRSCGCNRAAQRRSPLVQPTKVESAAEYLRGHGERLVQELIVRLGTRIQNCDHDAFALVEALRAEFDGAKGRFLQVVDEILEETGDDRKYCRALQNAMAHLRHNLRAVATSEIEDLWHDARDRILATFMRSQLHQSVDLDDAYWRLIEAGEKLSYTFDLEALRKKLGIVLPHLRLNTVILATCVEETPELLAPVLSVADGHPSEDLVGHYAARELFPPGARPGKRHTMLVFPLDGTPQHVGLAMFGYHGLALGQQLLRNQISGALSAIRMYREMVEQNRRNERIVQERAATMKRLQSLSVLAGGVAHDLNNAIGPLVALPDVLLCDLGEAGILDTMPNLREDIDGMKASALRAAQTIKDLLTLGRQGRTAKAPIDLGALVAASLRGDLLRFLTLAHPNVRIRVDVVDPSLIVSASEDHLLRAIANLVRNAAEAIRDSGDVVIKLRRVRLEKPLAGYETIDPGEYAVVSISDSGSGIPEHDLSRIFEPFFSRKRVNQQSGSGLGLAIVHGVVKEHEGFVDVSSTMGTGTTFTLYFPAMTGPAELSPPVAVVPRGQAKVLLVDDDGLQLRTTARILRHLGYEVDTLDSGDKAHAYFVAAAGGGTPPYDLVIMDMILGEARDGLAIIEEIRRIFPGQKAMVLSGHAPNERAELAVRSGMTWLTKPCTTEVLAKAVHAALSADPAA